jgi:2-keto-3-deoxy-L-fuconate dehydrogenase
MGSFHDAVVLVTGAASGIGAATAFRLAEEGIEKLILVDVDGERLRRTALSLGCAAECLVGDVADPAFWRGAAFDRLTHAVVNAGIGAGAPILDLDFQEWRRVLSVNLDGAFLTLQAAMGAMRGRGGSIVLTASAAGLKAEPGIAAYGASKAAVIHLARIAAKEGGPMKIRVNAIAPGGVETPIWRGVPFFEQLVRQAGSEAAAYAAMAANAPLGRFATAEEIAGQIAFLLSDAAATITGACLVSDGGYVL